MKSVKIAELKAKLSKYIQATKEGESIVVYDRNLPVAKIIPFEKVGELNIISAKTSWAKAWAQARALKKSTDRNLHLAEALLEMREEER